MWCCVTCFSVRGGAAAVGLPTEQRLSVARNGDGQRVARAVDVTFDTHFLDSLHIAEWLVIAFHLVMANTSFTGSLLSRNSYASVWPG